MLKVFLSYRRDDLHGVAQGIVGRIYDRLEEQYGGENVFMDVTDIPPGANFVEYLDQWVSRADVVLAVIGPQWAEILVARRADPRDFIRIELEAALARGIPVVPLLLRGARMPGPDVLTGGLARLAERQAFVVDDGRDFKHHVGKLIGDLDTHYSGQRTASRPEPQALPVTPVPKPKPVSSPSYPAAEPKSPISRRPSGLVIFLLVLVLVLVVAMGFAAWSRFMAGPTPSLFTPRPEPPVEASPFSPVDGTSARPYQNTLGMRFVGVPGTNVAMSIWETRLQDYAAFAEATPGIKDQWKSGASRPDLPVVNVSWDDAQAFCKWLSQKEGKSYRLPTDHEWSLAVGIGDEENPKASPREKDGKIEGVYPWGKAWPPPKGAGNYYEDGVSGYADGHDHCLAPVGSYDPNPLGMFDLGGNVWEWCEDKYDPASSDSVQRGASWSNWVALDRLSSSYRIGMESSYSFHNVGFRVVMVVGER